MKTIAAAILLFCELHTALGQTFLVPSFPAKILEAQFPLFKGDSSSVPDLRHYRQQLEYFRDQSLEGYNRALKKYLLTLKTFDKELEKQRQLGSLKPEEYAKRHQFVLDELEKSGPTGEYMEIYTDFLAKYKKERDWVIPEITSLDRAKVKF